MTIYSATLVLGHDENDLAYEHRPEVASLVSEMRAASVQI
jgi:hypothetical protein